MREIAKESAYLEIMVLMLDHGIVMRWKEEELDYFLMVIS